MTLLYCTHGFILFCDSDDHAFVVSDISGESFVTFFVGLVAGLSGSLLFGVPP